MSGFGPLFCFDREEGYVTLTSCADCRLTALRRSMTARRETIMLPSQTSTRERRHSNQRVICKKVLRLPAVLLSSLSSSSSSPCVKTDERRMRDEVSPEYEEADDGESGEVWTDLDEEGEECPD